MGGRMDILTGGTRLLARSARKPLLVAARAAAAAILAMVAVSAVVPSAAQENDGEEPATRFAPSLVQVWIDEPISPNPCGARVKGGSTGIQASTGRLYMAVKADLPGVVAKWFIQEPAFVKLPAGSWDSPITFMPCELLFFDNFTVCPVLAEGPPILAEEFDARPGTRVGDCAEAPKLDWSLQTTSDRGRAGTIFHWLVQQLDRVIAASIVLAVAVAANRLFGWGR